jgi:hypothetical protein
MMPVTERVFSKLLSPVVSQLATIVYAPWPQHQTISLSSCPSLSVVLLMTAPSSLSLEAELPPMLPLTTVPVDRPRLPLLLPQLLTQGQLAVLPVLPPRRVRLPQREETLVRLPLLELRTLATPTPEPQARAVSVEREERAESKEPVGISSREKFERR